ncbi:hypothetical protein D3C81_1470510 [compost metagenome]
MSYTLYLLHADFGFFQRAMWDRVVFKNYPDLRNIFTDPVVVGIALISSLGIAALVSIFLEPPLQRLLRKMLNMKQKSAPYSVSLIKKDQSL